jgi:hypothetical protein
LEKLSKDNDWNVRLNVAENPNCSVEILDGLGRDEDFSVRHLAKEGLK